MIIKKWNGTTWINQYPKTVTDMIYTGDGVTQIFNTSDDKIKPAYLPDAAYGDMAFVQGFDPAVITTLLGIANACNAQVSSDQYGVLRGKYVVATAQGSLPTEGAGVNEYDSTVTTVNPGDWIICREEGSPNIWDVVSNGYSIASGTAPGIVQIGYSESGTNYAVKLNSNKMYVTVPIPSLGDVGAAAASHNHGGITSSGTMTNSSAIGSTDHLLIRKNGSNEITSSTLQFGTGTTTYLLNNGTWGTPDYTTSLAYTAITGRPTALSDLSNDMDYSDFGAQASGSYAAASHSHGGLGSGGIIGLNVTIGNGDKILIADSTDSDKIKGGVAFASTHNNEYLRKDGTWQSATVETHSHGGISDAGLISSPDTAIATGDHLMIADHSASNLIAKTTIEFDTAETNKFLLQSGAWGTPQNTTYAAGANSGIDLTGTTFSMETPMFHGDTLPTLTGKADGYAVGFEW